MYVGRSDRFDDWYVVTDNYVRFEGVSWDGKKVSGSGVFEFNCPGICGHP